MRTGIREPGQYSDRCSGEGPTSAASGKGVPVQRQERGQDPAKRARWSRLRLSARLRVLALVAATAALLSGLVVADAPAGAATSSAPGVTSDSVNVGAISTLSGPLASNFGGLTPGIQAYFDMVNAKGGVNGRKLNLEWNLDDTGSPSAFTSLAHTLVDQDHAFAVFSSTYWFTPGFLAQTGTPTYGYDTSANWSGPDNLYAAGGSVQCDPCGTPGYLHLARQLKTKSAAILAYNVSSSKNACSDAASLFRRGGVNVSYTDYAVPIDGNITPDIQRMQKAGADFVLSCMDVNENITMARAIQQYGLKMNQLWLNGNDQSVLNQYSNLMQNVYFLIANVPIYSPTKYYPGLAAYLSAMKKYEPAHVGEALAVQGWESAALFAAGVRAAGNNLTQQRVIQLTNQLSAFNAEGMSAVTDWQVSHTKVKFPVCEAYTKVSGKKTISVFVPGHQVFLCFIPGPKAVPQTPPAGTPGT